ncbi:GNAT family N-acetyltransferase [Leeia aquatica]|nr:GNAT family N-acetyltransferase [Leeia aquatica]
MLSFRPLLSEDQTALWNWLHVALWDPPPAGLRPRSVLDHPEVSIYAQDWGKPGDVGVVAVLDGVDIGACWMRMLKDQVGLAWVDNQTPQLGISLGAAYQHQGHGGKMMRAALEAARQAGYRQVSLTVHPQNPARQLYARCGFEELEMREGFYLMRARL